MSRLPTPAIDEAPIASLLDSPAALQGYLDLVTAIDGGTLGAQTSARIARAVAEQNGCEYCLSLHTERTRRRTGLDDAEITANRSGVSDDPQAEVAVRFAAKLVRTQGVVGDDDIRALKAAGYDDGRIIEIVLHAGLNTLTGYLNKVADTEIDFPAIKARKADWKKLRRAARVRAVPSQKSR